jgi:hypothetical protein
MATPSHELFNVSTSSRITHHATIDEVRVNQRFRGSSRHIHQEHQEADSMMINDRLINSIVDLRILIPFVSSHTNESIVN